MEDFDLSDTYDLGESFSFDSYLYTGGKVPRDIRDTVVHVIVDSSVKEISAKAFTECATLSSVQLPDGLEKIGKAAFCNCQSLSAIYLPDGLKEIAEYAFSGCSSLVEVHANNGMSGIKIGNLAFSGCKLLPLELQRIMTTNTHVAKPSAPATPTSTYRYKGGTLPKDIRKTIKHLIIDSSVKKIDDKAFKDCVLLSSVEFPNGLETIGKNAFTKCSSLASVQLPNGLKHIDRFAFFRCSSLFSLELPDGMKVIGSCAFRDCSSLSSVQFPDGLTTIDESAFQECSSLFSLHLPNTLQVIHKCSFQNCSSLSSVEFPNGLKEIDERAFNGCSSLSLVRLPNGLGEIGNGAFSNCSLLSTIHLPNGLKTIGDNAFKGCSSITSIDYPNGLKRIGESSFRGCSSLSSIELASGLETIGEAAFSKCSSLASVTLPDDLKTIDESTFQDCSLLYTVKLPKQLKELGESAFQDCSSLSSINLPTGLKRVGESAFKGCSSLSSIHLPQDLEVIRESAFSNCSLLSSVQLPNKMKEIHRFVFFKCSSLSSIRLPDELQTIEEGAFQDCSSFSSIQFPFKLSEIGASAFKGCYSLSYVQLPNQLEVIANGAFEDCSAIASVHFPPGGLKSIGESAFKGCSALTSVQFPDGLEVIKESAFSRCSSLSSIQLPSRLKTIEKYAFLDCTSLSSLKTPNGLKRICTCAFKGCTSIAVVQLFEGIEMIDSGAFQDCSSIITIQIPTGLDKIGISAFKGCTSLYSVLLPNQLNEIGEGVFQDCSSLTAVEFPDGVQKIGKYAFQNCTSLTSITLPDQLKMVHESSFFKCSSLSSVKLPDGVELIGKSAFSKCSSLLTIELPRDLQEIGHEAFKDCSSLASIQFPIGLVKISRSAFESCSSLSSVHIPMGLMMIEEFAFRDCISLAFVYFPKRLVCMIAEDTFLGCTLLAIVAIPSTTNTIGDAFRNCKSLERTKTRGPQKIQHLKSRFKELPLHEACYEADEAKINEFLTEAAARVADEFYLLPLHILASNPKATESMIRLVADEYPDAITTIGTHGMSPLHFASINHGDHVIDFLPHLTKGKTPGQGKLGSSLQNADSRTPTALSILYTRNERIQRHLFERQPCNKSQFDEEIHHQVQKLEKWYVDRITSLKPESGHFTFETKHGWVKFVTDVVERSSITDICNFIRSNTRCPKSLVRALADAKDDDDRKAFDVAVTDIKSAFFERLLFLSRYEIKNGPPIHKSETCVVVEAFDMKGDEYYRKIFNENTQHLSSLRQDDFKKILSKKNIPHVRDAESFEKSFVSYDENDDGALTCDEFVSFCKDKLDAGKFRKVALKFMFDKDQFRREIEYRENNIDLVKREAVIEIVEHYNASEDRNFESAMKSLELAGVDEKMVAYRYAIVMPCADRNLDAIARSEKPSMNKVRSDAHQIAESLSIFHDNDIIHGDLKLQNILRMGEKLIITDLDASAKRKILEESKLAPYYVGKKFSSGILPPEMICCLKDNDLKSYLEYFDNEDKRGWYWKKIKPKKSTSEDYFVVKTFEHEIERAEDIVEKRTIEKLKIKEGLPYDPVEATPAVDLWSFGTILFFLCARFPLFKVNVNDDLVDGDVMEALYNWDDERKEEALQAIEDDSPAKELLSRLLSKDPDSRGTIVELLEDPFFNPDTSTRNSDLMSRINDVESTLVDKMDEVKKDVIRAAFEANEVTHPTTFVVLKHVIPCLTKPPGKEDLDCERIMDNKWIEKSKLKRDTTSGTSTTSISTITAHSTSAHDDADDTVRTECDEIDQSVLEDDDILSVQADEFFQELEEKPSLTTDQINKNLEETTAWLQDINSMTQGVSTATPDSFFSSVKRKFNSLVEDDTKTMYLYLIDELTGQPVMGPGYPIRITQPAEIVPHLVPYMQNSIRLMSLYNGVASVAGMFCPGIPRIPAKMLRSLSKSVNGTCREISQESSVANWKVVHDTVIDGEEKVSDSVRGASLRQLGGFFDKYDPQRSYAGLRRIPGNDGVALWTLVPEHEQTMYLERRHSNLLRSAHDRDVAIVEKDKELQSELDKTAKEYSSKFFELESELKDNQDKVRKKEQQIQRMEAEIVELKKAGGCACVIM